jgi:uncharacterized protein YfcZ (UPF0381/DUF406 family)
MMMTQEQAERLSEALQAHADKLRAGWLADPAKIEQEMREVRASIELRKEADQSR